jgi:hypothetical protein
VPELLKLNLGGCDRNFPGFLNVDIVPPCDIQADLSQRWPWADSSVAEVIAFDVFEHLPCKYHTMNELWRVLQPGGIARLQIPHATDGDGGHCDPQHCSYWTQSDFEYYTPGLLERERFRGKNEVNADFRVKNLDKNGHIPTTRHTRVYGGYVVEMHIVLEAVK